MVGRWWKRLGFRAEESEPGDETVLAALEAVLEDIEPVRAERLAAFAGLLARVAFADEKISEPEVRSIARIVAAHGNLSEREAQAVSLVARDRTVALRGVDDHLLSRRFNRIASEEDRVRLIECLYAVATADDLVTHVEDQEIRRIADALMLPSRTVMEIRSRHREKLEELRALRAIRNERR